jgi:hypothetical protein
LSEAGPRSGSDRPLIFSAGHPSRSWLKAEDTPSFARKEENRSSQPLFLCLFTDPVTGKIVGGGKSSWLRMRKVTIKAQRTQSGGKHETRNDKGEGLC